jgi:hypothetical protein
MNMAISAALSTALLLVIAAPADAAQHTAKRQGVEAARGVIDYSRTAGEPFLSFPLGCTGDECHYSLWIEYVPAGEEPLGTDIYQVQEDYDQCAAWVQIHNALTPPMAASRHERGGIVSYDQTIHSAYRKHGSDEKVFRHEDFGPMLVGAQYEYFKLHRWWIEVRGEDCRIGYVACSHDSIKEFDNRALTCPLVD